MHVHPPRTLSCPSSFPPLFSTQAPTDGTRGPLVADPPMLQNFQTLLLHLLTLLPLTAIFQQATRMDIDVRVLLILSMGAGGVLCVGNGACSTLLLITHTPIHTC